MTVVDRFSKMAYFVALARTDAASVASAFFSQVVCHVGMPTVIISDRDPRFTGQFWQQLMTHFNTQLKFSTAYHPQTDGMAEVTNRTLAALLRTHCADTRDWYQRLPLVQMVYNSTPQSRTGESPHLIATGRDLLLPIDTILEANNIPVASQFTQEIRNLWRKCKLRLEQVQKKNKLRADKSRRQVTFGVGDLVLLSTRHLRLKGSEGKLKPRFVGPFSVLQFVGANAVKFALPDSMRVHPVFNVEFT